MGLTPKVSAPVLHNQTTRQGSDTAFFDSSFPSANNKIPQSDQTDFANSPSAPKNYPFCNISFNASKLNQNISPDTFALSQQPGAELSTKDLLKALLAQSIPGWINSCHLALETDEVVIHLSPKTSVLDRRFKFLQDDLRQKLRPLINVRFAIHPPQENVKKKLSKIDKSKLFSIEPTEETQAALSARISAKVATSLSSNSLREDLQRQSRICNEDLFSDVTKTLPLEVELLRPLRYVIPLDGGSFDFLVLKLAVPPNKEASLQRWRNQFEERNKVSVLIERASAFSGVKNQLRKWSGNKELITHEHIPSINRYLNGVFGKPPSAPHQPLTREGLVDLTHLPLVAIDSLDTLAREDLVYAEPSHLNDHVRLTVAFIDVTPFIRPGCYIDRYAERVGSSVYGSHSCIPTLGTEIAYGAASFLTDQPRSAWVVDMHIDPSGQISQSEVAHAKVASRMHLAPEQVNQMLLVEDSCPLVFHYLQIAASRLHTKRRNKKQIMLVQGDGLGGAIVGESMLAGKSALANFLLSKKTPAIFKVHNPPTPQRKQDLTRQIAACGIAVKETDFDEPRQFAGILQALEKKYQSPQAQHTLREVLDVFLTRSRYDTQNRGHYGIGVDAYIEIKPRDAAGIPNQYQLLHLFDRHAPLLPLRELEHRASRRNRQSNERSSIEYQLRFYERIKENLTHCGKQFVAKVREIHSDRLLVEVNGFTKWGFVQSDSHSRHRPFSVGQDISVTLKGFSIERMRFLFGLH